MKYDMIDQQSYEAGYAAGLDDGYKKRVREERRREDRKSYCILQKALGIIMLAIMVLCVWILDGDATIALFLLPISLLLIFSQKPIIAMKGVE